MAIYKIFASADTTLYSAYPAKNTGLDEIIEVSVKNSGDPSNSLIPDNSTPLSDDIRRGLVRFSDSDLNLIKNKVVSSSWTSNLRLYLANAENLTTAYNLYISQVHQDWTMGTGKFLDYPETRNGACWYSTSSYSSTSSVWNPQSFYLTPGGGSWSSINYTTCSFDYNSNKDINCDVTAITNDWFSGSNQNTGFIIKHEAAVERNRNSYIVLSFFSKDTHTIYPPCLEFKWDDSSWVTGSLSTIGNQEVVVTVPNILEKYKKDTFYRFNVNARDKYPARVFTTSSLYTVNKYLPSSSYWAIQDYKTEEMIVDFDKNYTKLSADSSGNYFTLYMNGLEPERSYKILLRYVLPSGISVDIDNGYVFKIIR